MRKQITAPTYNDDRTERYEKQVMNLMYSANCLGFIMGIKKAAQAVQEGACDK